MPESPIESPRESLPESPREPALEPAPWAPAVAAPAAPELIPLASIDAGALSRDRTGLDAEPQTELQLSIAATGLRQPIEVFPLATPRDGAAYGLLSGYRRLFAFRTLHEQTGQDRYATIPAFVRERTSLARAMAAMVEENEIRAGISPYERGLICVQARKEGAFASIEEAVEGLFPAACRMKRMRLRTIAQFADEIGGFFAAPEKLSQRQVFRIARALDGGFGDLIRTALEESSITDHDHQWMLVEPILSEADENTRKPETANRPGRPRRVLRPRYGLTIRRERTRDGWSLHFTGREASGPMIDLVLDEIERMYAPA